MEYARHFHFFDDPTTVDAVSPKTPDSGWLHDVSNFTALPGKGVQCFIHEKRVLVSSPIDK